MPPYMLPGVPVHQPAHLEGDPALATEILPGPPSLVSAQQSAQKRDPKKLTLPYSYLPPSDPGSTYSGIMHGTLIGHEEPHSKRSRSDKGSVFRSPPLASFCSHTFLCNCHQPTPTHAFYASQTNAAPPDLTGIPCVPAVQPVVHNVLQREINPP